MKKALSIIAQAVLSVPRFSGRASLGIAGGAVLVGLFQNCSAFDVAALRAPAESKTSRVAQFSLSGPTRTDAVEFRPTEDSRAFRNPGIGWLPYAFQPVQESVDRISVDNTPLASTLYSNYFSMGDLNPYEGYYNFEYVDRLIFKARQLGQKVSFGVVTSSPNSLPWDGLRGYGVVPFWLLGPANDPNVRCFTTYYGATLGAANNSRVGHANYGCHHEPFYWRDAFLSAHQKFVRALAERYYNPSSAGYPNAPDWRNSVEAIDLATYGFWGEWHSDLDWTGHDKRATTKRMIDDYLEAFSRPGIKPDLQISSVLSAVGNSVRADGLDDSGVIYALGHGASPVRKFIGLDVGIEGTAAAKYFKPDEMALLMQQVQSKPFRGEFGSWNGNTHEFTQNPDGSGRRTTLEQAIDQALSLHASQLGWYWTLGAPAGSLHPMKAIKPGTTDTLEEYFAKHAGYRLVPRIVRHPESITPGSEMYVDINWAQLGVAKMYKTYGLRAYLIKQASPGQSEARIDLDIRPFDATTWPLGPSEGNLTSSSFHLPATLQPGNYRLQIALVDQTGQPAVNLAITGKDRSDVNAYGRYDVGALVVRAPVPVAPAKPREGFFSTPSAIYYSNGVDAFCHVKNWDDFMIWVKQRGSSAAPFFPALPPQMRNDGDCRSPQQPAGFFRVGNADAIYYSNGTNGFCVFDSWPNFVRWNGGSQDTSKVAPRGTLPSDTINYGVCQ